MIVVVPESCPFSAVEANKWNLWWTPVWSLGRVRGHLHTLEGSVSQGTVGDLNLAGALGERKMGPHWACERWLSRYSVDCSKSRQINVSSWGSPGMLKKAEHSSKPSWLRWSLWQKVVGFRATGKWGITILLIIRQPACQVSSLAVTGGARGID